MKVIGIPEEERLREEEEIQESLAVGAAVKRAKESIRTHRFFLVDVKTQKQTTFIARSVTPPGRSGQWFNTEDPLLNALRPEDKDSTPVWPYADDAFAPAEKWLATPASLDYVPHMETADDIVALGAALSGIKPAVRPDAEALLLRSEDETVFEIVYPFEKIREANQLNLEWAGLQDIGVRTVAESCAATRICGSTKSLPDPSEAEDRLRTAVSAYEDAEGLHIAAIRKISDMHALRTTKGKAGMYESHAVREKRPEAEIFRTLFGHVSVDYDRFGMKTTSERTPTTHLDGQYLYTVTMDYRVSAMSADEVAARCRRFAEDIGKACENLALKKKPADTKPSGTGTSQVSPAGKKKRRKGLFGLLLVAAVLVPAASLMALHVM